MALDTTVGGPSSDSYVTIEEANSYFAAHWSVAKNTTWSGLSDTQKEAVLKAATRVMETMRFLDTDEYTYDSTMIHKSTWHQKLSFPRHLDIDWETAGNPYVVPREVKDAQCEQAVYLVGFDEAILASQIQAVREENSAAGPVSTHAAYRGLGSSLAPMAYELLRPYLRSSSNRIFRS